MTGPGGDKDIPVLGFGQEGRAWMQVLLMTANAVRQYRMTVDRAAWSQERAASRATQRYAADLDPRVRAMAAADEAAFRAANENDPAGFEHKRSRGPQFGWTVHTSAGPMPKDSPSGMNGAWGLWAHGSYGEKSLSIFVVAPDQETALRLRDEVTEGEQRTLKDLGKLGTYGFMRAEHARTEVREGPTPLRRRLSESLHEAWPDDRNLAAAVMEPGIGESGPDYSVVDRLTQRLRGLEDRGYSMVDVLRRVDLGEVRRAYEQRDEASMDIVAARVDRSVQDLAAGLQVVDADPVDPVVAREAREALDKGLRESGVEHDRVYGSSGLGRLRAQLIDLRSGGHDLDELLKDLPGEKISSAREPAAYLWAVLEQRARTSTPTEAGYEPGRAAGETQTGIGKTGPDLGPAERMIRRHFAPRAADSVITCAAWPGLAKQLLAWKEQGAPISAELTQTAQSIEGRLPSRSTPAAYLKSVLRRGIDFRENWSRRSGESEEAQRDSTHAARVRLATEVVDPGPVGPLTEAMRDGVPPPPFDVHRLDPTNAIDRVGLEMARGAGTVRDDDYIEQVLAAPDPGEVWARFNRVAEARGRAADAEAQAAGHARTPDDLSTVPREDLIGQAEAGVDRRRADRDRALARAEEIGAPTAAALRAESAHRPPEIEPGAASPPRSRPITESSSPPVPVRRQTPGPIR